MIRTSRTLNVVYVLAITLIVLAGISITWFGVYSSLNYYFKGNIAIVLIYIALFEILMHYTDGYDYLTSRISVRIINQSLIVLLLNMAFYIAVVLISKTYLSILPIVIETAAVILLLIIWILAFKKIVDRHFKQLNILFLYADEIELNIVEKFYKHKHLFNIKTQYCLNNESAQDFDVERISSYDVVLLGSISKKSRAEIIKYCFKNHIGALVVPTISDIMIRYGKEFKLIDTPILSVRTSSISHTELAIKRIFDIFISLVSIIVLSPIIGILALAIKVEDGGPVFYRQQRYTKDKKIFLICKFRSMIENAESGGNIRLAAEGDDRITKVGKFMRKLRLDEIPQLFNILKGDMALIGPRPERPEIVAKYEKTIPEFAMRTEVKAGLSGLAQVQGRYNTTPYDKLRLDLFYINNYSLFLDAKIIFQTISILFLNESTEGISKDKKVAGE